MLLFCIVLHVCQLQSPAFVRQFLQNILTIFLAGAVKEVGALPFSDSILDTALPVTGKKPHVFTVSGIMTQQSLYQRLLVR